LKLVNEQNRVILESTKEHPEPTPQRV
jgi:hypothetical protein